MIRDWVLFVIGFVTGGSLVLLCFIILRGFFLLRALSHKSADIGELSRLTQAIQKESDAIREILSKSQRRQDISLVKPPEDSA